MNNSDIAEQLSDRVAESKASTLHGVDQVVEPGGLATASHNEMTVAGAKALAYRYRPVRPKPSSSDPPLVASLPCILRPTTRLQEAANDKNALRHCFVCLSAVTIALARFTLPISRTLLMLRIYQCNQIEGNRLSPAFNIRQLFCERIP